MTNIKWYNDHGYWRRRIKGKLIYQHRWLMNAQPGEIVDHINGDTLDNRLENLRLVTKAQNAWNASPHCDSKTGIKGIYPELGRNSFAVSLMAYGKSYRKSGFKSLENAIQFKQALEQNIHGKYAR